MSLSRSIYIVLVVLSAWLTYYLNIEHNPVDIQVTPNLELPMFSGNDVVNTTYSPLGIRNYKITSVNLDYYAKSGNTTFNAPILNVYRDGTIVEWKISAKRGILTKNQVLTLYDDVVAENLIEGASFDTLKTSKLSIQLTNNDFWAENDVVMQGAQFQTLSHAMKGNFTSQVAELYNHVQGVYENLEP
jgi:lipopolysaccharide export system protein LptC